MNLQEGGYLSQMAEQELLVSILVTLSVKFERMQRKRPVGIRH